MGIALFLVFFSCIVSCSQVVASAVQEVAESMCKALKAVEAPERQCAGKKPILVTSVNIERSTWGSSWQGL